MTPDTQSPAAQHLPPMGGKEAGRAVPPARPATFTPGRQATRVMSLSVRVGDDAQITAERTRDGWVYLDIADANGRPAVQLALDSEAAVDAMLDALLALKVQKKAQAA